MGALSTIAALASYSLARTARDAIPHVYVGMTLAPLENRWFLLGTIGGAVLGALGTLLAKRRKWTLFVAFIASLLILEPVLRVTWAMIKGEPPRTLVPSAGVWWIEVLCGGVIWFAFSIRRTHIHQFLRRD